MISSVDNPRVKDITKLHLKKYRDQHQRFIVEGEHLVVEAQKSNAVVEVFITKPYAAFPEAQLVSPHVMKKMTDTKQAPTIMAVCQKTPPSKVTNRVLILESIQDPGNLGTLMRSALAFGFKTLILNQSVDCYNPKVLRATQGALFHLSVYTMDTVTFKQMCPNHTIYATALSHHAKHDTPKEPYALILGNEGQGLTDATLALADHILTIPVEQLDSLNVAVAGSILMHAMTSPPLFKG